MAPAYRHNPTAAQNSAIALQSAGTVQLRVHQQCSTTSSSAQSSDRCAPVSLAGLFRNVQTEFAKIRNQGSRPVVNIALSDYFPHTLEAQLLLFRFHFQGGVNGLCRLVDVVGVYLQRVGQFSRRTGKATKDQNPPLVAPCRHKLLRP